MTWLSGWSKRIQLDIDSFYVDEDLTDFPVLITLSSGVGRNGADVRGIFSDLHELEIDYNNWNPDDKHSLLALSNNDLTVTATDTGGTNKCLRSIYAVSSGKWYWEVTIDVGDSHHQVGIGTENVSLSNWIGAHSEGYVYTSTGTKGNNNSYTAYGDAYVSGDIIGVALDLDSGDIYFSKNGVWQNSGVPASGTNPAFSGLSGTFYAMHSEYYASYAATANFGDTAFSYSVPDGYNSGFYSWVDADNTKKIMITTTDNTPCYTEIESWDWTNERAWLWTKVPTITSGTDTTLYLYYDKTQPDNDHYVGDTGDLAAKNVWDSDFVGVWHYNDVGSSSVLDSTSNTNHGSTANMDSSDVISTNIGNGHEYNGSDEYAYVSHNSSLAITSNLTVETVYRYTGSNGMVFEKWDEVNRNGWGLLLHTNGKIRFGFRDGASDYWGKITTNTVATNDVNHITIRYVGDNSTPELWVNGTQITVFDSWVEDGNALDGFGDSGEALTLGGRAHMFNASWSYTSGQNTESRISNTVRSDAWIKIGYYSCSDNLVTFGSEELEPLYYFDGFVYEKNTPVSRVVRVYDRSTGSLMGTDTSRSSDGYYYVTSTSSGTHFLVAFDDDAGDEYNALILDKVAPKGTVY